MRHRFYSPTSLYGGGQVAIGGAYIYIHMVVVDEAFWDCQVGRALNVTSTL